MTNAVGFDHHRLRKIASGDFNAGMRDYCAGTVFDRAADSRGVENCRNEKEETNKGVSGAVE
jgi:hypothetical protein